MKKKNYLLQETDINYSLKSNILKDQFDNLGNFIKKKRKIMDKIPEDLGKNRKIIYPFTYI